MRVRSNSKSVDLVQTQSNQAAQKKASSTCTPLKKTEKKQAFISTNWAMQYQTELLNLKVQFQKGEISQTMLTQQFAVLVLKDRFSSQSVEQLHKTFAPVLKLLEQDPHYKSRVCQEIMALELASKKTK